MKVRLCGDPEAVAKFLTDNGYPTAWSWPSHVLDDYAIMARISTDEDETAAYVWATWDAVIPDALDFHVCTSPAHRGHWLTDGVWSDLRKLAELLGAREIVTRTVGDRAARLVAAMLQRRFGFYRAPDGTVRLNLES